MSFQTVAIDKINDNPFRNNEAYVYNQKKIDSLKESIADTSFWENLLARKTKDGRIELCYGHHRLQAIKQLVEEGMVEYAEIRINVRSDVEIPNEVMLKILIQENKDEWGEEAGNLTMSLLQVQAHLETLLPASKTKDDFLKRLGSSAGALKVDERSFTRMKNAGVGASVIQQFLGDTWSRQTIQEALQVIQNDEATYKLAQNLPSITLASRFQKLVIKDEDGEKKTMFDEQTQRQVADAIVKNNLTRSEVEAAIKLSDSYQDGKDPIKAIKAVVEQKKGDVAAAKKAAEADKPAPKEPVEKVLGFVDRLLEATRRDRVNLAKKDIARIKKALMLVIEILDMPDEQWRAKLKKEEEMAKGGAPA